MLIGTLDIETTDLSAVGAGFIICAVVKPYGGTPKIFRYDKYNCKAAHEGRMLRALVAELAKYDMLIGHNIQRFDMNYIKSRSMVFGIPFTLRPLIYDTLHAFRRCGFLTRQNGFGKPTASLAFVVDFLGIKQEKTGIHPREHWKSVWENGEERNRVLTNIIDHCIADVQMTETVYRRLLTVDSNALIRRLK